MTSYRTDKTSRIILAIFIAYAVAYGVARNQSLRLVNPSGTNDGKLFIQTIDPTSESDWIATVFWPAIKLEETVRNINQYF